MAIRFDEHTSVFHMETEQSSYQMKVDSRGMLLHLHYGKKIPDSTEYLIRYQDRGFSGNPYAFRTERGYSQDLLPQEYSGRGMGDYRVSALETVSHQGSRSVELFYLSHRIYSGRKPLEGLPYVRGGKEIETLEVVLRDPVLGLQVELVYHVFEKENVISRSVRVMNESQKPIRLEKAASFCLDFSFGTWDLIRFHGRHCMERQPERQPLPHGITSMGSRRGMSSHHANPFVILCEKHATERRGNCYGMMLMYSGNHLEEMEVDQMGSTRIVGGIHPDGFSWLLQPGEAFQTPEAIMSFSAEGLNGLSGNLHDLIRCRVVPKRFQHRRRPVLLNSWEAVYFDFNAVKLLEMGRNARELGIEMLVLDDGWFGKREADTSGLGDWQTNEKKLGCSLGELSDRLHEMGLGFGLWIEPEMISEDSDLYRSHPDWALADPDRNAVMSREQLVLDMARTDVQDYLYDVIALLLEQAKIEYLKWDFNRSVANVYSRSLPPEKQGEVGHRFVLGTYRLLERLTAAYPEVLIEGCAGGGGRFDAGMLFYCPQIWCSDNTDAVERLEIQRGTSYGYPICTMGAHVSSIPNHQTGRVIPLETRALVAGAGTFGYELNPKLLTEEEKRQIRQQIQEYHRYAALVEEGRYYRLTELDDSGEIEAWMFVSPNRREALVGAVCRHVRANGPFPWFRLEGLKPETIYRLQGNGKEYSGTALMYAGISFPLPWGDYAAWQLHFQAVE